MDAKDAHARELGFEKVIPASFAQNVAADDLVLVHDLAEIKACVEEGVEFTAEASARIEGEEGRDRCGIQVYPTLSKLSGLPATNTGPSGRFAHGAQGQVPRQACGS